MRKKLFQTKRFHKKHTLPIVGIVLGIVLGIFFLLEQKQPTSAQSLEIRPANAYVDVVFPGQDYASRTWEFTPLSYTEKGYFWAYQQGFVGGDGFYVGLQDPARNGKKLVLFSVWQSLSARTVDEANGSWCQTFGGEGEGYSCRINYEWVLGRTYEFGVKQVDPSWWEAWIKDAVTGKKDIIGKIQVPQSWGGLTQTSVAWTEYFGGVKIDSCNKAAYAKGHWGNIVSDDTIRPASYNSHVADTACKQNTQITLQKNGFVEEMGASLLPKKEQVVTKVPNKKNGFLASFAKLFHCTPTSKSSLCLLLLRY